MSKIWPQDRIDLFRKLYDDGHAHSVIAERCGITRNSSIGKANRLGLKRRRDSLADRSLMTRMSRKKKPRYRGELNFTKKAPIPKAEPMVHIPETIPDKPVKLQDLKQSSCHWPYGDKEVVFGCVHPRIDGSSYCRTHHARSRRQG